MKAVSLSLKILAILGACFCIYAWVDTRGKVSQAEANMKDVPGATLQEKSAAVPQILKDKADAEASNKAFRARVADLENNIKSVSSELESERVKNVQANSDIVKKNAEIRKLSAKVDAQTSQLSQKDALVENLKKEILATKELLANTSETDALKEKVATLESELKTKSEELAEAQKKAKLLEMSEVVEVVETDASGKQIKRKIMKTPYIPTGDIATVIAVDQSNGLVCINRGVKSGVKQSQKILLKEKKEGKLIAEITVAESADDFAICLLNRDVALPETIEVGDNLELGAPAAVEEAKEAAPAAEAEATSTETEA